MSAKEWILFALAALGLLPREERPGFARTPSDTEMITVLASVPVRDRAAATGVFRPLARLWPQLRMYFDSVLSPRSCLGLTRGSTQTDSLRLMRPDGRPAPSSPHFPSSGRVSSSLILHQASRTEPESGRYRVPAVTRSGRTTGRRTVKKTVTGSAETATCRNAVRQYRSPCGVAENAKNRLFRLRWLG